MLSLALPVPQSPAFRDATIRARGLSRCGGCGLPPGLCLCEELPELTLRTRIVLVVHHIETHKSTNTGRLLARIVHGVDVRVRGEKTAAPRPPIDASRRLVLYPDGAERELSPSDAGDDLALVVPDGTFSQARRMINRDPDLLGAEIVRLPAGAPSRYGLRRSPIEGKVSTFEAVARAIGMLEGPGPEAVLMSAFERFVERATIVRESGKGGRASVR